MPSQLVYNVEMKGALDDEHASSEHLSLTQQKQRKSQHEEQLLVSSWPTRSNVENQKQDHKKEQHQVEEANKSPRFLADKDAQDKPSPSTQEEHNTQTLKRKGATIYDHIMEGKSNQSNTMSLYYQQSGGGGGDYYSNIEYPRENSNPSMFRGNIPSTNPSTNTNFRGNKARRVLDSGVDTNMLRMMMSSASPGDSLLPPSMPSPEAYAAFLLERSRRDQEIAKLIMSSSSYNHQSPFFSVSPSETLPSRWNHTSSPYHDESSIDPDAVHSSTPTSTAGSIASHLTSASIYSQGDNQLPLLPTNTATGNINKQPQLSLLPSHNSLSEITAEEERVSANKRKMANLKKYFNNSTSTDVGAKIDKGKEGTTIAIAPAPYRFPDPPVHHDDDAVSKRVREIKANRVAAASKNGDKTRGIPDLYRPFHYDPISMEADKQAEARQYEHFSTRPYMPLSVPEDEECLSPFLRFLRKECVEVFKANAAIAEERKCNKVAVNQVGIRCRFCAHIPNRKSLAKRSSCFPSSSCRIYQTLNVMLFVHFSGCKEIPSDVKAKFDKLKKSKGCCARKAPKVYWKNTAESLGMSNAASGGMFMTKPLKFISPRPLPSSSPSPSPSISKMCTDTEISATPVAPPPAAMTFDITRNS